MIGEALNKLCPGAEFVIEDNDYSKIKWIKTPDNIPTLEQILAEIEIIKLEKEQSLYKVKRKAEYPSIGDQLDALFHAGVFPPEMAEKIQSVKSKYPKPE
jgi:hypothetical protein